MVVGHMAAVLSVRDLPFGYKSSLNVSSSVVVAQGEGAEKRRPRFRQWT